MVPRNDQQVCSGKGHDLSGASQQLGVFLIFWVGPNYEDYVALGSIRRSPVQLALRVMILALSHLVGGPCHDDPQIV